MEDVITAVGFCLFIVLIFGSSFFIDSCMKKRCKETCQQQYGEEFTGRQGVYEACDCISPTGDIKAPR